MNRSSVWRVATLGLLLVPMARARSAELAGSPASMVHQHTMAVRSDYTFSRTASDVRSLVEEGELAHVATTKSVVLSGVSFPYARPEVAAFIEHLARAYRDATGARLVVTSLTRPAALQPGNAHALSVHPAGMAVDFRVPQSAAHRARLEELLIALEQQGMVDVTRERRPPHYHVAVFAEKYAPYAARLDSAFRADSLVEARRLAAEELTRDAERRAAVAGRQPELPARYPLGLLMLGGFAMLGVTGPVLVERRRRASAIRQDPRTFQP